MAIAILVLGVVAFLTSMLSGMLGMGGGTLFLAALFCFLSQPEAISMHSSVQVVTHVARLAIFWKHIDWPTLRRFCLGGLPGTLIGGALLYWIGEAEDSEPYLKGIIGLYIFIMVSKRAPNEVDVAHARM